MTPSVSPGYSLRSSLSGMTGAPHRSVSRMNRLKPLVPALVSFGPIFMVMGTTWSEAGIVGQVIAYVGAIMLALGCGTLFRSIKE